MPGTHGGKERTDSRKLSSGLHVCILVYVYLHANVSIIHVRAIEEGDLKEIPH